MNKLLKKFLLAIVGAVVLVLAVAVLVVVWIGQESKPILSEAERRAQVIQAHRDKKAELTLSVEPPEERTDQRLDLETARAELQKRLAKSMESSQADNAQEIASGDKLPALSELLTERTKFKQDSQEQVEPIIKPINLAEVLEAQKAASKENSTGAVEDPSGEKIKKSFLEKIGKNLRDIKPGMERVTGNLEGSTDSSSEQHLGQPQAKSIPNEQVQISKIPAALKTKKKLRPESGIQF